MKKEGREKEKVEKGRGKKGREKYSKNFFFLQKTVSEMLLKNLREDLEVDLLGHQNAPLFY